MSTARASDRLARHQPLVLGLFRVVLGLLFTSEGVATVFGVLGRKAAPAGDWPFWYAGVIELVCGALVLLGCATRGAAFLSSGAMAFAYFTEHQQDGLFPLQNGGLAPALFCWGFLLLVFFGPGALSLTGLPRSGAGGDAAASPASGQGVEEPRESGGPAGPVPPDREAPRREDPRPKAWRRPPSGARRRPPASGRAPARCNSSL